MKSLFAVFLSKDLKSVAHFTRPDTPPLEIAFMLPNADAMPESIRTTSSTSTGVVLTLDFDDVDRVYNRLVESGAFKKFVLDPTDEAWGQRHFMFVDPSGLTVDVVQSIAPSAEYDQAYSVKES